VLPVNHLPRNDESFPRTDGLSVRPPFLALCQSPGWSSFSFSTFSEMGVSMTAGRARTSHRRYDRRMFSRPTASSRLSGNCFFFCFFLPPISTVPLKDSPVSLYEALFVTFVPSPLPPSIPLFPNSCAPTCSGVSRRDELFV